MPLTVVVPQPTVLLGVVSALRSCDWAVRLLVVVGLTPGRSTRRTAALSSTLARWHRRRSNQIMNGYRRPRQPSVPRCLLRWAVLSVSS